MKIKEEFHLLIIFQMSGVK